MTIGVILLISGLILNAFFANDMKKKQRMIYYYTLGRVIPTFTALALVITGIVLIVRSCN